MGVRRVGPLRLEWMLGNFPIPRLSVTTSWDDRTQRTTGFDVSLDLADDGSDPVLGMSFFVPWRRPRPYALSFTAPPRYEVERPVFKDCQWRRP